jgi:hypothetical protein
MILEGIGFLIGVWYLLKNFEKDFLVRITLFISSLLLLLIWSPGPLMGYHGQLKTTIYPSGFESLRRELQDKKSSTKILALPWHSYFGCQWTGRPTIANPIKWLLSPLEVVSSDNIEVWNILYSNSQNTRSRDIETFLSSHVFAPLSLYGINRILLMKNCANSDSYTWLDITPGCILEQENNAMKLYICNKE